MQTERVPKRFARRRLVRERRSLPTPGKRAIWAVIGVFIIVLFLPLLQIIFGPMRTFVFDSGRLVGNRYLVLLQNEAELRPAGGFLSAFAVVETGLFRPKVTIADAYAVSPPAQKITPPWPLEEVFSADPKYRGWEFRDANFFADFPESAAQAIRLLAIDPNYADQPFDGVVAINLAAVEALLADLDADASGESLFLRLQRETKDIDLHSTEDLKNRKNALGDLADRLIDRLGYFALPGAAKTLAAAADRKEVQMWFADPSLQKKARAKGWSGELPDAPFFAVNTANLGAKKSDRYLTREFRSEIEVNPGGEMAESFTITLRHEGSAGLFSGEGRYLVRVLRPRGTRLVGDQNGWLQTTTDTTEEFALLTTIAPGEDLELTLDFLLPLRWQSPRQELLWVKQSGTTADLTIVLRGKGDTGFAIEGCDTSDSRENIFHCRAALTTDRSFFATLIADTLPPIVENALFTAPSEVFLRFSEPVTAPLDPADFVLSCPDGRFAAEAIVRNPQDLRDATVVLPKALPFDEAFCTVDWQGITDLAGNAKTVTMTLPRRQE